MQEQVWETTPFAWARALVLCHSNQLDGFGEQGARRALQELGRTCLLELLSLDVSSPIRLQSRKQCRSLFAGCRCWHQRPDTSPSFVVMFLLIMVVLKRSKLLLETWVLCQTGKDLLDIQNIRKPGIIMLQLALARRLAESKPKQFRICVYTMWML